MLISSKINNGLHGCVNIPGDKSISHRSIMIPSISKGISEISNLLISDDVLHTINAMKAMGVKINTFEDKIIIHGNGLNSLKKPLKDIYLGNSGTGARLLTGLLSAQNFKSALIGDESLSSRPIKRITTPIELMGGKFKYKNGTLPLHIFGKELKPISYKIPIPSAQVKSGIILAALNTKGQTTINETSITRNHTEIMLKSFGANIKIKKESDMNSIFINGKQELTSKNIYVPCDLSSSSFFIVAAMINKNSNLKLQNININPTRDGILHALKLMGGNITISNQRLINDEIIGDIEVQSSHLKGCELNEDMAKLMIDEYPILSVAASFAKTPSLFKGLKELKVKESDRLELIRFNLNQCGITCEVLNDNLFIDPRKKNKIKNNKIKTSFDHRIAMAFAIMGSKLDHDLQISNSNCINTSFPNFIKSFNKIGGNLIE